MVTTIFTFLAISVGVLVTGAALIWVLQQRRSPQSAVAWILFIITVPYIGVPAFFIFGTRKRGAGYETIRFAPTPEAPPVHAADALFRRFELPGAAPGHRLDLETTSDAARASLDRLIAGAQARIDVVLYRLEPDPVGRAFTESLTEAVRRGVRVRVILDQFGTIRRPYRELHRFKEAGGELQMFSPLPQIAATGRFNLRNHRKKVIVDGKTVWSGGRNIGQMYQAAQSDPETWNDLSFTLTGPVVARFCEVFEADWAKMGGAPVPITADPTGGGSGRAVVQLLASGPDFDHDGLHDGLVHLIHTAKTRIWIATPYFLPTDMLQHALRTAARLGRDVRILVPARSNQRIADFARGDYLRDLEEAGCTILRHTGGMVHAKVVVIDDIAMLGSANLDVRSMLLNFEASLMVYDAPSVSAIAHWFSGLEAECLTGTRPAHLPRRLAEAAFRLGAPML